MGLTTEGAVPETVKSLERPSVNIFNFLSILFFMEIYGFVEAVKRLKKIGFIWIWNQEGRYQLTIKDNEIPELTRGTVIRVIGELAPEQKFKGGKEIIPHKIEIISEAETPLPIEKNVETTLSKRLDWRSIDLRDDKQIAIFKIQSTLVKSAIDYLTSKGFILVSTPSIIGTPAETGAGMFEVKYFDKKGYLRQDPQLHRELTILGGITKLVEFGPSWRAEPHNTTRHLCEHRSIAVEIGFIKNEDDVIKLEEDLVTKMIEAVVNENQKELEILNVSVEVPKKPFPVLKFPEIYDILKEMGEEVPYGEEYTTEGEKKLGEYVKEKYGSDFFFVKNFPAKVKPFYVYKEGEWARSVDLIYKGMELSSGGQREHRYEKIIENAKADGMNIENLSWFTKFFKYGAPTMGGFSIGVERLTMKLLNLSNIREATLFPRDPERLLP